MEWIQNDTVQLAKNIKLMRNGLTPDDYPDANKKQS